MEENPQEVDVTWLVVAILLSVEEKIEVLQVKRTPPKNWQGQTLKIIIQATLKYLERISPLYQWMGRWY